MIAMQLFTSSLLLLCLTSRLMAQSHEAPSKRLIGAWRLISAEGKSPVFHFVFDHPRGLIIYDASGRMSVQIANIGDRKPFVNGPAAGTTGEKAAAFDGYNAYYGTYTIDTKNGTITHHIEDGTNPALRGGDNVRWFEFQDDDHLVLIAVEDGKGGVLARKDASYKIFWERIK
jgi:Lipocalin-like domain